jgi:transcriptional regulator with XRE-family HTH domain
MNSNLYLVAIGKKIKSIRMEKKISIRKLGVLCDLDYANLSRLENGQKDFHITTLQNIADNLNVDIKDFL